MLIKVYPDYKTILTVYLDQTPPEITDAATAALRVVFVVIEVEKFWIRMRRRTI